MHHLLNKAYRDEGSAWGAKDDSDPNSSPDLDSNTSLEGVICIELLSLLTS